MSVIQQDLVASAASTRPPKTQHQAAQRLADVLLSSMLLLVLSPLYLAVWIAIRLSDGGPGLYRQERVGKGGELFTFLKFRTMKVDSAALLEERLATCERSRALWDTHLKLADDPRITPFGRFLRRSSIDELPQLFNVLRGDMSLIGPRPLLPNEISRYGRWYGRYISVRPGLTGLWQISGRSLTTFRRRVAADVIYVRRRTILLKVYILLATIPAVLFNRGSS
jgi:exopolysaccharide production protein ExoY